MVAASGSSTSLSDFNPSTNVTHPTTRRSTSATRTFALLDTASDIAEVLLVELVAIVTKRAVRLDQEIARGLVLLRPHGTNQRLGELQSRATLPLADGSNVSASRRGMRR